MNNLFLRWSATAALIGLCAALSTGCAVEGGGYPAYGYGPSVDIGLGVDYYEPYGGVYGGWGPGYRVGPYRDGGHPPGGPGRGGRPPSYRPASTSHGMPSIPSHVGGGGNRRK